MKTKMGMVGPQDSINRLTEEAEAFQNKLILFPFTYTDVAETESIVKKNDALVDVWLFSGQAPFTIAKEVGLVHQAFYPPLNGSSLMKTLFRMTYHNQLPLTDISLDTLPEAEIQETFQELGLPIDDVALFPYSGYRDTEELTAFHYDLFTRQQIKFAVTCVHAVYKQLKSLAVPVYRVTPTALILRQTMEAAHQQRKTTYFKHAQIVVIIIQTYDMDKLMERTHYHRLNLQLQELIIGFSETILGTYVLLGNGKFMVFSTRGSLNKDGKFSATALLEQINLLTNLTSNMGIGYGKTSKEAEKNAYFAFRQARNQRENCAMLVDETGLIEGPFMETDSIAYCNRTDDKQLESQLNKAGVSISTFNKILYVQSNLNSQAVSTADIAEWLHMTQRNARRILTGLEKQGLAEKHGQEAPIHKGRPRNIYRIVSVQGK